LTFSGGDFSRVLVAELLEVSETVAQVLAIKDGIDITCDT